VPTTEYLLGGIAQKKIGPNGAPYQIDRKRRLGCTTIVGSGRRRGRTRRSLGGRARTGHKARQRPLYSRREPVFCPTKASLSQFRQNLDAAVSYFVGNNMDFHEDTGFALQPWSAVRFENFGIQITGDFAVTMGNYFFQNAGGVTLKAEYTLVYRALQGIGLRIVAHHSAIPFEA